MNAPSTNPSIRAAQRLKGVHAYSPPRRPDINTLRLDSNEGVPIDASLLECLRSIDHEVLSRYPDQTGLESEIAKRFGVDPRRVVVTNGADDAIDRVCRALLDQDDAMLTHAPGFEMIPRSAKLCGSSVRMIEWISEPFPEDEFLNAITQDTKLIALVSPNNPTGQAISATTIVKIQQRAEQFGAAILLDQAYVEFAETDPINDVLEAPNLIITRTFSKSLGLAGLRVGYAIAPEPIADMLRAAGGPYPVSSLSLTIAKAAMRSHDNTLNEVRSRRQTLEEDLKELGANVIRSEANFLLAKFRDPSSVHASLLERGISVRRFAPESIISDYLRITIPSSQEDLDRLANALRTIMQTAQEA